MKHTLLLCGLLAGFSLAAAPELVMVGDAGNPGKKVYFHEVPNPYPRGGVAYPYRIGRSEVSNAEYAEFLNACAAESDPHRLFDERMKIVRSGGEGAWKYAPAQGREEDGVNFVSRVNAARYCNWLTTGDAAQGAYTIAEKPRENGRTFEAIVGYRDLTFPDAARVYVLPDMHEFFKAGWYDGDGKFRELNAETRSKPSRYGIVKHASGLREHMENKFYAGAPFVLGADDKATDAASLNTARLWQQPEYEGRETAGFRVAATAPLQIGDRLNRRNNFFFDDAEPAKLRIRSDAPAHKSVFRLELRDFANRPVWNKQVEPQLKPGVTELPIELPAADGYYELRVTPEDASFNGGSVVIPLAVMRDAADNGAEGNFGFTCHITRRERRYSFEEFDFDLLRRLGVSNVRVDVGYNDIGGSQSVLRRIRAAGLNPLAIITGSGVSDYDGLAKNRAGHPELVRKWAAHGIPADYAWYAEQVYNLISAHKDVVRDWEFGNEPTYWKVLPEDYAQMLKAGYKAAKLADPDCNVMAGDLNAIHAPVFRTGGAAFCDSIASHIYGFYVPMFWGIAGKMREMNGWKNAAGIPEKPVWLTEIGGCTYSSMHMIPVRTLDEVRRYQAIHQPKVMAGGLAFGAAKVIPYNFRDVPVDSLEEEFGMLDRYGRPKPGAASFRATAKLLGKAKFSGFVKGHSLKSGEIAGLAFRDAEGRDVVTLWRNDPYGYDQFKIPFFDMVRAPQPVALPAEGGSVELFNLSGGASKLDVKNGSVEIPVSEYPVFVRGRLKPELEPVSTAHAVPPLNLPRAKVKILPKQKTRACDLMSGTVPELAAGTAESVKVHVYNLKGEPLSGSLRLVPKSNWREWGVESRALRGETRPPRRRHGRGGIQNSGAARREAGAALLSGRVFRNGTGRGVSGYGRVPHRNEEAEAGRLDHLRKGIQTRLRCGRRPNPDQLGEGPRSVCQFLSAHAEALRRKCGGARDRRHIAGPSRRRDDSRGQPSFHGPQRRNFPAQAEYRAAGEGVELIALRRLGNSPEGSDRPQGRRRQSRFSGPAARIQLRAEARRGGGRFDSGPGVGTRPPLTRWEPGAWTVYGEATRSAKEK